MPESWYMTLALRCLPPTSPVFTTNGSDKLVSCMHFQSATSMHVSFKGDARSLPGDALADEAQQEEGGSVVVEVPPGPGGGAQYENRRHALSVHRKQEMYHHFRTLATFVDYAEPQPNKSHGTKGKLNSHIDIKPPH